MSLPSLPDVTTARPKPLPDPRIMLGVVFVTGTCLWLLPPAVCLVLGVAVCCAFAYWYEVLTLPPRTLRRLAQFILFWLILKILLQYAPLALSGGILWEDMVWETASAANAPPVKNGILPLMTSLWQGMVAFLSNHSEQLYATGLFCVQLTTLVLLGILMAGLFSAYSLACAFNWFLRPLPFVESWRPALALALLLHYLPRIYETLDTVRNTAIMRNLPSTGFAYWKLAFPRFFSHLAEQTWAQAIAVASRNLDNPAPWTIDFPIPRPQILFFVLYAVLLLASVFLP